MKRLITLFSILNAIALADKKCTGVFFNEKYYETEIIKDGVNNLHSIVYNINDNTAYFIFDEVDKINTKKLGYVNIDNKSAGTISGIRNASSIAVDQRNNKVYVGSPDGLFLINYNKVPEAFPIYENIESVFFKDVLYYTNKWKAAARYVNGRSMAVPELDGAFVERITLDDDDNIFFLHNKTKLFRIKLGTRAINSHENYYVNYLTTDLYYRPFILTNNGVFIYNKYKYAFDKISNMKNLKALTFSKANEPIYVVNDVIVRLKLSPLPCYDY